MGFINFKRKLVTSVMSAMTALTFVDVGIAVSDVYDVKEVLMTSVMFETLKYVG